MEEGHHPFLQKLGRQPHVQLSALTLEKLNEWAPKPLTGGLQNLHKDLRPLWFCQAGSPAPLYTSSHG
jgi:hypothetical protein